MTANKKPAKKQKPKSKSRPSKSLWQTVGNAAFDKMSEAAITSLKERLGLNTEQNFIDTNGTTTATTTLVSRIAMATIPQGAGVGSRIGASIRITSAELFIQVAAATTATNGNTIRVLVTRNGSDGNAAVGEVLQTTTSISSPIFHLLEESDIELLDDFTIDVGMPGGGNSTRFVKKTYTGRSWHCQWPDTDTTGTPSTLLEGAINVFWFIDAVYTAAPVFTSTMRLNYVDN